MDVVSDCAEAGAGCLLLLPLYAIVGGGIYAIYHATATEDTWTYHPLADDDQVRTVFASILEETDFRTTLPQEIVNQAVRRSRHDIRFQPEAWIVVPKFQDGSANGSLKVLMDHVGFVSRRGKVNEVSLQIRSHANLYVVREQELVEYRSPEISYESERENIDRWLENRGALLRRELKTATEAVAGQIVDWISSSNESGTTRWIGVPRRRVLQLLQSAQDGDAEAQWHLGNISLEENAKLHWYCKAAKTGNSRYLFEIGTLHLQQAFGDGAKPVWAYVYFDLAARNGPGVPRYADYRDRIGAQLEPEEIADAERLAVYWTPKLACPEGVS